MNIKDIREKKNKLFTWNKIKIPAILYQTNTLKTKDSYLSSIYERP